MMLTRLNKSTWLLCSIALMLLLNLWLDWYMTFLAGALLAWVLKDKISGFAVFVAGGLGWEGAIFLQARPGMVTKFAGTIGGAFGLPDQAATIVVLLLPFLLGGLLAACGSWLIRSAGNLRTGKAPSLERSQAV